LAGNGTAFAENGNETTETLGKLMAQNMTASLKEEPV